MSGALVVEQPGPLATVQDEGRPGLAEIGVGRSGACDRTSYRLANRLVGNPDGAAALEVTLGGLVVRAVGDLVLVATGARCPGAPHNAPVALRDGEALRLGTPAAGLRTYLAVRGGLDVPAVLGSRASDLLGGLGPAPLAAGDRLPVGELLADHPGVDLAPVAEPTPEPLEVRVVRGPRHDWFSGTAWRRLVTADYVAGPDSNRVGVRLQGPELPRTRSGELPSEGLVRGALQVPPAGRPVLFLADHPVTGGYPVIGYVVDEDVDRCGQLRPGQGLRLRA